MLPKNKFFVFITIALFSCATLLFSESPRVLQTLILEDFELEGDGGAPKRYWTVVPDRVGREGNLASGKNLQELRWVKAWPEAYFGTEKESGAGEFYFGQKKFDDENGVIRHTDKSATSMSVKLCFNRQGYRTVELYPLSKNEDSGKYEKAPIPFKGKVEKIDFWVWGSNFNYNLQLVLVDYRGVEHRLDAGSLKHIGWKSFSVEVPKTIPQSVLTIPSDRYLTFKKFVIWTDPNERVSGATYYFDHITYVSDVYSELYDGYKLGDREYVEELEKEAPQAPDEADVVQ